MEVQAKERVKPSQADALLGEMGRGVKWVQLSCGYLLSSQFGDRVKSLNLFSVKA